MVALLRHLLGQNVNEPEQNDGADRYDDQHDDRDPVRHRVERVAREKRRECRRRIEQRGGAGECDVHRTQDETFHSRSPYIPRWRAHFPRTPRRRVRHPSTAPDFCCARRSRGTKTGPRSWAERILTGFARLSVIIVAAGDREQPEFSPRTGTRPWSPSDPGTGARVQGKRDG